MFAHSSPIFFFTENNYVCFFSPDGNSGSSSWTFFLDSDTKYQFNFFHLGKLINKAACHLHSHDSYNWHSEVFDPINSNCKPQFNRGKKPTSNMQQSGAILLQYSTDWKQEQVCCHENPPTNNLHRGWGTRQGSRQTGSKKSNVIQPLSELL